jgi:hypothetical protein
VHDVERTTARVSQLVCRVEPSAHVGDHANQHRDGQAGADPLGGSVQLLQRIAVDPLHHQVQLPALLSQIENLRDVDVLDARSDLGFVQEHATKALVLGEGG